jgi:hypothetical protein
MSLPERLDFLLEPAIQQRRIRPQRADRVDCYVQVEFLPKLVSDVLQNALSVVGREQIGLAQKHLGRDSSLIEVA